MAHCGLKMELLFLLCFFQFKVLNTPHVSVREPFVVSRAVGIDQDCVVEATKPGEILGITARLSEQPMDYSFMKKLGLI